MDEIITLDKAELLVINGVLVKKVTIKKGAKVNLTISNDRTVSLLLNKYSHDNNTPDKAMSEDGRDYYITTLVCFLGVVEIDFVVRIKDSNMFIDRIEVKV